MDRVLQLASYFIHELATSSGIVWIMVERRQKQSLFSERAIGELITQVTTSVNVLRKACEPSGGTGVPFSDCGTEHWQYDTAKQRHPHR